MSYLLVGEFLRSLDSFQRFAKTRSHHEVMIGKGQGISLQAGEARAKTSFLAGFGQGSTACYKLISKPSIIEFSVKRIIMSLVNQWYPLYEIYITRQDELMSS